MVRRVCFVLIAIALLGFEFFPILAIPAHAQSPTPEPTPTLVPPLASPPITDTWPITLSLQTEQAAEFALYAFYQAQDNAAQLSQLEAMLTLTDPVVVTDTLPSGNQFAVRREFTYGEIVVGIALIALLFVRLLSFAWDLTRSPKEFGG